VCPGRNKQKQVGSWKKKKKARMKRILTTFKLGEGESIFLSMIEAEELLIIITIISTLYRQFTLQIKD
jgi:hypothetical protein